MPIDLNEHLKNKRAQMGQEKKEQNSESNNSDSEKPKAPKRDFNNFGGGGNGGNNGNNGFNNFGGFNGGNIDLNLNGKKITLIVVVALIILILVVMRPFAVINSGFVGIKSTTGKFDPVPLQPGLHFFIPFFQTIKEVDTRVRTIHFSRSENMGSVGRDHSIFQNDALTVLDSRGLTVSIELTVQYQLNNINVPLTIATYGDTWEQKLINPVVRDVVRGVIGKYPAEELPTKRDDIAREINMGMENEIAKFDNDPVRITSVQLREIVLPAAIREQIERVQVARQEADRVKLEVERAKQEAEKVAALAKGEADANRERAQGQADAITIEAKAQAAANRLISESLSPRLLDLRQIEVQGKFNEALKENKDAQIFLTPGGSTPNIWVDSKNKQRSTSASER